jgi:hypothetical protein
MGSSVVARLSGGAGVAWMVAGFGAKVARSAKTPTGARAGMSARTPYIGSSVVAGLSGRAVMAWLVAGFWSWVSGVAGVAARAMVVARLERVARRVMAAEMAE